jgi:hypothetical protein
MIILITFEVRSLLRGSVGGQDLERSVIARVLDDVCIQSRSNRNVSFSIANGNVKIRKGGGVRVLLQVVHKNGTCEVANDLAKEAIEVSKDVQYISLL